MSTEASRLLSVHASAVAIGGHALLITGPSRAGKSRLAYALLSASSRRRPIRLIGDDRILLVPIAGGAGYACRPHPRIAGFIEIRGLGIVAMSHVERVPLAAVAALGESLPPELARENFPVLSLVHTVEVAARCALVLRWWASGQNRGMCTTQGQESAGAAAAKPETLELVTATRSYISASRGVEAVRSN